MIRSADLRPWWLHREQHAISPGNLGNLGNMVVSTLKNMLFCRKTRKHADFPMNKFGSAMINCGFISKNVGVPEK